METSHDFWISLFVFVDFWSQNIKIPQLRIEQGTYNGEAYNVVVWRKTVLYPQKTGKLILEPLTLNVLAELPTNRRDFFGDRIMRQVNRVITAGETSVEVKPLPESGKPEDFTGAVGRFDFDVLLNKKSLKASESFQARIKVTGTGNLILFDGKQMYIKAKSYVEMIYFIFKFLKNLCFDTKELNQFVCMQ